MYPCEFMCSVKKTILFSSSSMDEGLIKRPFIASPPPYFSPPRHHFRIGKNFAIIALPPLYIFNRGKYRLYRFATTLIFNWGILHLCRFTTTVHFQRRKILPLSFCHHIIFQWGNITPLTHYHHCTISMGKN